MSDVQSNIPGGYFTGRPQAAGEQQVAATHTPPGDYFIGRPESHHDKEEQGAAQKQASNQSTPSFLAKCCPCLASGGAAE